MKLILLGAPGAGKGTVAKMLTKIDGSVQIRVGTVQPDGANDLQSVGGLLLGHATNPVAHAGPWQMLEQLQKDDATHESADMGPPGNSAHGAGAAGGVDKLQNEPESKKEVCRDFYEIRDENDQYEGQDFGPGMQNKIGSHDTGNGTAGSDRGNIRVHIQDQMG